MQAVVLMPHLQQDTDSTCALHPHMLPPLQSHLMHPSWHLICQVCTQTVKPTLARAQKKNFKAASWLRMRLRQCHSPPS